MDQPPGVETESGTFDFVRTASGSMHSYSRIRARPALLVPAHFASSRQPNTSSSFLHPDTSSKMMLQSSRALRWAGMRAGNDHSGDLSLVQLLDPAGSPARLCTVHAPGGCSDGLGAATPAAVAGGSLGRPYAAFLCARAACAPCCDSGPAPRSRPDAPSFRPVVQHGRHQGQIVSECL
jgi:hypothetical protein